MTDEHGQEMTDLANDKLTPLYSQHKDQIPLLQLVAIVLHEATSVIAHSSYDMEPKRGLLLLAFVGLFVNDVSSGKSILL